MLLLEAFDIEQNTNDNFLDFDILCFSETHLDAQISNEFLFLSDIFNEPYRKDKTYHGHGVMIYLNSQLKHVRRADLEILVMNPFRLKFR